MTKREAHFQRVFATLGQPARGSFFRLVKLKYQHTPLSAIGSKDIGGRYNPAKEFEILYAADGAPTALHETNIVVRAPDGRQVTVVTAPYILFTVAYTLQVVVDLTDPQTQLNLGVTPEELKGDWRLIVSSKKTPITHRIGRAARAAGVEALIVPSAKNSGTTNIAIIIDQLLVDSSYEIAQPDGFRAGTPTRENGTKTKR